MTDKGGRQMTVARLAALVDGRLAGDGSPVVRGVNTIADAGADEICFLTSEKYFFF